MNFRKQRLSRRQLMKRSAVTAAGAAAFGVGASVQAETESSGQTGWRNPHRRTVEETSIADLQAMMEAGTLTSRELVAMYLDRIDALDRNGPKLNSIIETNPDALEIASQLDQERSGEEGQSRGPLHGIPIVVKDNIDTADRMLTTAGSLALVDSMPGQDAGVVEKLREAGAIILGKAGLSEWANFRGNFSSSGWSARGGQVRNPYIIDRNPCGSSSGSGTAPAASLVAAALGTETDGSIVCPSNNCGVVGIKPTVGLTSRAGVIPISHTQDTIGPMARTVADAAAVLTAIAGVDARDPATEDAQVAEDYTTFLNPEGLSGARIGVARQMFGWSPESDRYVVAAINAMREAGATIVDPVEFSNFTEISNSGAEFEVLLYEFKWDLADYLATRTSGPRTLAELIQFNLDHYEEELLWFGQEVFLLSEAKGPLTENAYLEALETSRDGSRASMDQAFEEYDVDAIVAPTGSPAWMTDLVNGDLFLGASSSHAARAGYPLVSLPAGYFFDLPMGITFMGRPWDEGTLISLASGFEATVGERRAPQFLRTLQA